MRSLPPILRDELPAQLLDGRAENMNTWNWQPYGVSNIVWSLVKGSLGVGLNRDAILQLIRGTQDGVLSASSLKPDEEGEERDVEHDLQHPEGPNTAESAAHGEPKDVRYQLTTESFRPLSDVYFSLIPLLSRRTPMRGRNTVLLAK